MNNSLPKYCAFLLAASCGLNGCIPKKSPSQTSTTAPTGTSQISTSGSSRVIAPALEMDLSAHFASQFSLGVAMQPHYLHEWGALTASTFNRLTAENAMKFAQIHPQEANYNFAPADILANFARKNSMKMSGHTLVWYRETPSWLVQGDALAVSARLKSHIDTVIARYADVIDNWDVLNEGISDSESKLYRDASEGSMLHGVLGDELAAHAFRHAEAAVMATGKEIDLYYNDYNMSQPRKLKKALQMAQSLKEAGIRIDGIGAQAHWNLTSPSINEVQAMIDAIVAAGLKVKISELDVSIYSNDDWVNSVWQPELPFTEQLAKKQAIRYKELFEVFAKNADHITSVTLWGVSDDRSWLNAFPSPGRNNHPLLFDGRDQPKPAYFSLFKVQ